MATLDVPIHHFDVPSVYRIRYGLLDESEKSLRLMSWFVFKLKNVNEHKCQVLKLSSHFFLDKCHKNESVRGVCASLVALSLSFFLSGRCCYSICFCLWRYYVWCSRGIAYFARQAFEAVQSIHRYSRQEHIVAHISENRVAYYFSHHLFLWLFGSCSSICSHWLSRSLLLFPSLFRTQTHTNTHAVAYTYTQRKNETYTYVVCFSLMPVVFLANHEWCVRGSYSVCVFFLMFHSRTGGSFSYKQTQIISLFFLCFYLLDHCCWAFYVYIFLYCICVDYIDFKSK